MKRRWIVELLALSLALLLAGMGIAEELGDVTLYDIALSQGDVQPEAQDADVESAAGDQAAPEGGEALPETVSDGEQPPADEQQAQPEAVDEAQAPSQEAEAPAAEQPSPEDGVEVVEAAPAAEAPAPEVPNDATPDAVLGVGEQLALAGAAGSFLSADPAVATVDGQTGLLTACAAGTVVITGASPEGAPLRWIVVVRNAPDRLIFDSDKYTMGVGETGKLTVSLPGNTAASRISWSSSKKSVVTVDDAGNLKAKKKGSAVITATAYNGAQATCKVKVVKAPSKVTLSATKATLCVGETRALSAKLPSGTGSAITWTSSDADVVAVDGSGALRGVAAGKATVTAVTFNGKKAKCKVEVLAGSAPTTLSLGMSSLSLGVGEKYRLKPAVGEGEAAVFSFSTSKKSIVTVDSAGNLKGKKRGSATITVTTQNGLKQTLKVKVVKAPGSVTLSRSNLAMRVGETAQLSAWTPTGTASAFTWSSGDKRVATVDASGVITALKAGETTIQVKTFNGKTRTCALTVTEDGPSVADDPGTDTVDEGPAEPEVSRDRMVANLRASGALGAKRDAIANVAELLMNNGFEPAFAAGVGANIYSEGTYGLFESSRYVSNPKKRPRYFCYLDGGEYYSLQAGEYVLTAVYMSEEEMQTYTGEAEPRKRFGEANYYLDRYSRKFAYEVNLDELEAFMDALAAGNWEGKFGLGIVQWTGGRTRTLVSLYRKYAGSGSSISEAGVIAAENEMILYDFMGDYKGVYSAWKNANATLYGEEAARSAGALVCTRYEIPVDKDSKAVTRGSKAMEIYRIMIGQ